MEQPTGRNPGQAENEPTPKKLRFSEPDLKIILKYKDSEGRDQQAERWHYSSILAAQSEFVDAALASGMKEKQDMQIIFDDTTPAVYAKALKCLEDTLTAMNSITLSAVFELVPFYDKYNFSRGMTLCDSVLSAFLEKHTQEAYSLGNDPTEHIDLLVDSAVCANKYSLPNATERAVVFVNAVIDECTNHREENDELVFGAFSLSLRHVESLRPIFKLPSIKTNQFPPLSDEDLDSSLFPKFFLEHAAFAAFPFQIKVMGTETLADGSYGIADSGSSYCLEANNTRGLRWPNNRVLYPCISQEGGIFRGDWRIVGTDLNDESEHVLWTCPNSSGYRVPPKGPWNAVHELVQGKSPRVSIVSM